MADIMTDTLRILEAYAAQVAQAQEEFARATMAVQPELAKIAKTLGPELEAVRKAAAEMVASVDAEALQAALPAARDLETLEKMRKLANSMAEQYESLAASITRAYTAHALRQPQGKSRLTENLERRWNRDAGAAERILRSFLDYKEDGGVRNHAGPFLSGEDAAIAGLYYFQELTQEESGDRFGLSQPSIANRLNKIDRTIAHHVLLRRLDRIAGNEGWDLWHGQHVDVAGMEHYPDLVARKREPNASRLAIEMTVVDGKSRWVSLEQRVPGWSETLASLDAPVYRVQALFDLSDHGTYFCTDSDLKTARRQLRGIHDPTGRVMFKDLRQFLPTSLSLDAALERATA